MHQSRPDLSRVDDYFAIMPWGMNIYFRLENAVGVTMIFSSRGGYDTYEFLSQLFVDKLNENLR